MEVETRSAALQLGLSQRQVQRLAANGRISYRSIAGRKVVASRSLLGVSRSTARGRCWNEKTVRAACELLENDSTELIAASQLSRLRARLRTASVEELAYQVLGKRVSIWRRTRAAQDTAGPTAEGLSSTGESLAVSVTSSAGALARRLRLLEDAEGDVLLVELDTAARTIVIDIALYAYGDERTSSAAGERIRNRQSDLA